MSDVRFLAEWFPKFAEQLDKMDKTYKEMRTIDEKTFLLELYLLSHIILGKRRAFAATKP
jgi:hypothetical protein